MAKKKPKRQKPEPKSAEAPLIFLDIDGVLAPFGGRDPPGPPRGRAAKLDADAAFAPFDEQCLARLAAVVDATDATIVLSSSWRASADAVAVIERRFRAFGAPLAGTVPLPTTDAHYHSVRQWEVARHLDRHPASRWVALDDEELVEGEECAERRSLFVGRVSTVDSTLGLQDIHVAEAIRVLTGDA